MPLCFSKVCAFPETLKVLSQNQGGQIPRFLSLGSFVCVNITIKRSSKPIFLGRYFQVALPLRLPRSAVPQPLGWIPAFDLFVSPHFPTALGSSLCRIQLSKTCRFCSGSFSETNCCQRGESDSFQTRSLNQYSHARLIS